MKNKNAKRIVAILVVVTCIAGMAISSSASTYVTITFSGCPSGSNRGPKGYSPYSIAASSGWNSCSVTSVGFTGVPAEVWPLNASIYSALYTGSSPKSTLVCFTAKNQVKYTDVDSSGTYRAGAQTTCSQGATIQEKW